ncbi:MAG: CRISPR-associated protein [Epsilonproteobacteria bacterium]|nr:CRISPR-associated protein [Campylobacterota bacterium]
MGDIITTFAKIGNHYLEDEKRVKNKAYEYGTIKVCLFDIETKTLEPSFNIPKEDLIITRFGVGANSGNLFPNVPLTLKEVNKNYDKFIRGVLKAIKNLLSNFSEAEIEKSDILKQLVAMDEPFFADSMEKIQSFEEYKKVKEEKGKVATYFALSFQQRPISSYFKTVFDNYLDSSSEATIYGYDILSNKQGVGGDANLAFCSVNELPTKLQSIKPRLLPLSFESAKRIKIGFDAMDKMLSHNFYGLKMAILPTLLESDESLYSGVLTILEEAEKGKISEIEESETNINEYLEEVAKNEKGLPVLNTILFYNKNNAAVDVLLQIDDVLPSYISHISDKMGYYNIKAFKNKDEKSPNEETIYMHTLFEDRLEIMNTLLSGIKIDKDVLIHKFAQLIYWGTMNKSYAYPVEWSSYFNGYYHNRSIEAIKRYLAFFNETHKLKENFILQEEIKLEDKKDKTKSIEILIEKSEFLDNEVLKSAYLLGMLSSALMNWQYGVSGNSSYAKWLNNSGAINKESLDRIWKKAEETIRKLNSTSGSGNATVNEIKELVIASTQKAFIYNGIVKSSYVSLAFAMGGSDYTKYIKEPKKEEKK